MTAKELWNKLEKNCKEENGKRYPVDKLSIKGAEIAYVEKSGNDFKVYLKESNKTFNPSIYGTPEEQLTHKFSLALKKHLGLMEGVTDHDYVTNSYHVNPGEQISWKEKLDLEGKYLYYTKGGAVSYIETDDLRKNPKVIESVIRYMNDHIAYAEVNTTLGTCFKCGFQGDFALKSNEKHDSYYFECPKCHNVDQKMMNIVMRLCGYIGTVNAGETSHGRMSDFAARQKARHIKIAE